METKNTTRELVENVDCRILFNGQHQLGIDVGGDVRFADPKHWHRTLAENERLRMLLCRTSNWSTEFPQSPLPPGLLRDIDILFLPQRKDDQMSDQIENNFSYHAPKGNQPERYEAIRNSVKRLAIYLDAECPDSREKSLAMTKLEEAVMWANAAIARNEQ